MTVQSAPKFVPILLRGSRICASTYRLLFKREAWGGGGVREILAHGLKNYGANLYSIRANYASWFQNLYPLPLHAIQERSWEPKIV